MDILGTESSGGCCTLVLIFIKSFIILHTLFIRTVTQPHMYVIKKRYLEYKKTFCSHFRYREFSFLLNAGCYHYQKVNMNNVLSHLNLCFPLKESQTLLTNLLAIISKLLQYSNMKLMSYKVLLANSYYCY